MCPICKSDHFCLVGLPEIDPKISALLKISYQIVKCSKCYFYYLQPQLKLSKAEFEFLYNESYFYPMSQFYEAIRQRDRYSRFNKIEKLSNWKIETYLDIGCGEGFSLIEANKRGWKAYGVDIYDNRIEEAINVTENFILSDLIGAKFPSNFFDIIYIDSVLEHITNPYEYLLEIKRILTHNGLVYIGVPNEDCFFNDIKKILYKLSGKSYISNKLKPFKSPYHIGGFNKKSLPLAIENADFNIVNIRNFAGRLNFLNPRLFSRDFWIGLVLIPVNIISFIIRREEYLEVYINKTKVNET
jgi:SAM-dependent methyltransferase